MKPWTVFTTLDPFGPPESDLLGVYKVEPFFTDFLHRSVVKSDFETALKSIKEIETENKAVAALIELLPLIVETLINLGDYCMKNVKNPYHVREIKETLKVMTEIGMLNRGII